MKSCPLIAGFPLLVLLACPHADVPERVVLRFPALPEGWAETLGDPDWRLEWTNDAGESRSSDLGPRPSSAALAWEAGAVSAVLAHPHWPRRSIGPGVFRPAGAVYPVDRSGEALPLTWTGGVAAWYYREMERAEGESRTRPERFNWVRFYELLGGTELPERVAADPWTVDWRSVAEKTRASGFDRRRLVARPAAAAAVAVPAGGPWICSSPFVGAAAWSAGSQVELQVEDEGACYACPSGLLRCTPSAQAFFPW